MTITPNKLQIVDAKDVSKFEIDLSEMDHLIGAIENYKKENGRYPREIIMNKEFGQRYFLRYQQGVAARILYKNKPIWITVNNRFKTSEMFMR